MLYSTDLGRLRSHDQGDGKHLQMERLRVALRAEAEESKSPQELSAFCSERAEALPTAEEHSLGARGGGKEALWI